MPSLITGTPKPLVTPAAFKAHPTFLELDNLRSGSAVDSDQDAELYNILLMASRWAEGFVTMPLYAHARTDNGRMFADRHGRLKFHAAHTPVRSVSQISWGVTYGQMNTFNNPTVFREGDETIVYQIGGSGSFSWTGSLSLGMGAAPGVEVFTSWTYVAGYANALLTAPANAGTATLTVDDPTGIQPGDQLRLWDPGVEEAVTVAAGYTPGTTTVALTANLAKAHTAGAGLSQLPPDAHLAIINYGCAILTHPDRQAEDEWPDGSASSTRSGDARQNGSGLVAEAKRLLQLFRDTR